MAQELQTITTETSKKWSLSKSDFLRSMLTTLWVSVATILLQFLDAWITALTTNGSFQFDWINLLLTLKIAVATWIGDTVRRLLKESVTIIRVVPPIVTKQVNGDTTGSGDRPPVDPDKP